MDYILDGLGQAFVLLGSGHAETYAAIRATLAVSTMSIIATLLIGAPLGFLLGYGRFPGRTPIRTVVDILLSLPTVVIGLLVYAFLSRRGPLGELGLLFSLRGIAIGQTILGLPIVIAITATAVENLDRRLKLTLLTMGAGGAQVLFTTLWEARFSLMLAGVAAYGRIVSEVGISLMIGGNIKWHTRTITTAIALETGKGDFATGIALGMVLMMIAIVVNLFVVRLRKRSEP
jgi:tungstate transport system permease protein